MRKFLPVIFVCAMLCACATTSTKIPLLSQKQISVMSAPEVNSFYQAKNQELLEQLVYERGGSYYDRLNYVFNNMNAEVAALAKSPVTKEEYYLKLKSIVEKYRKRLNYALK